MSPNHWIRGRLHFRGVPGQTQFLEACDDWQFPLFLTLILTGHRPGELAHLLLPDDLDLKTGTLRVRNKPRLGWQVKTRNERQIPLLPELVQVLEVVVGKRAAGPVFLRRGFCAEESHNQAELEQILRGRTTARQQGLGRSPSRPEQAGMAKSLWWEIGALREDRIRMEFIRVARKVGLGKLTMPKVLRHQFATALQQGTPMTRTPDESRFLTIIEPPACQSAVYSVS